MATTEELVKKAFNEIGDQISSSTRELLNSIPKLERRIRELEGNESDEKDIPEKEHAPAIKSPTEMIENWHDARPDDEKNAAHADRIETAGNKNTRVKDAEEQELENSPKRIGNGTRKTYVDGDDDVENQHREL
jgi:hypothetical protein